LLTARATSAAPAGTTCIVAHTPGGDDHSHVVSAFNQCQSGGTVVFSAGTTYEVLTPIRAAGLSNVKIVVDGTVRFPYNNAKWPKKTPYWAIQGADVFMSGSGAVTADGQQWWDNQPNGGPPVVLFGVHNGGMKGVKFHDARAAHVAIKKSSSFKVSGVTMHSVSNKISKPTKNTDGIDISSSTDIKIHDTSITNDDDAIAMEGGASNIDIRRVRCGGTCHGISIGSLGPPGKQSGAAASVKDVVVEDASFEGCTTAIHIKSWSTPVEGFAKNITYNNLSFKDV
ncbi:pectin lyase fold/virulence factor, partial [Blyttiomyces helicus]